MRPGVPVPDDSCDDEAIGDEISEEDKGADDRN